MTIHDTRWDDSGLTMRACPTCGGKGYVVTCEGCMDATRCSECEGGGFVYEPEGSDDDNS